MKTFDEIWADCDDFDQIARLAEAGHKTVERVKDAKDPTYILAQIHKALEPYIDGET